jgi:transcriptional regulator with XRE-family HTH domain
VRLARLAAGRSLADIAGDDVSRTLIHFVETGQSRPSQRVLELIARRTGKPVSYFRVAAPAQPARGVRDNLPSELIAAAASVRSFVKTHKLTRAEAEAMRLVESTLRKAASLTETITNDSEARRLRRDVF